MNEKEQRVVSAQGAVRAQKARLVDSVKALDCQARVIEADRKKAQAEADQKISGLKRDIEIAESQLAMDEAYLEKAKTDLEIGFEQM